METSRRDFLRVAAAAAPGTALHARFFTAGRLTAPLAASLVLVGGFLLRVVIVLSSEGVG